MLVWVAVEVLVVGSGSVPGRPLWLLLHAGYFWGTAYWETAILGTALDAADGRRPEPLRWLGEHRTVLRVLALKMLLVPATLVGLALLVLPGLAVLARFGFAPWFTVARRDSTGRALAASLGASRSRRWPLIGLAAALLLLNLLGAALLGLGLLVSLPLTALAAARAFRDLVAAT